MLRGSARSGSNAAHNQCTNRKYAVWDTAQVVGAQLSQRHPDHKRYPPEHLNGTHSVFCFLSSSRSFSFVVRPRAFLLVNVAFGGVHHQLTDHFQRRGEDAEGFELFRGQNNYCQRSPLGLFPTPSTMGFYCNGTPPALYLHFAPQRRREVTSSANELLQHEKLAT